MSYVIQPPPMVTLPVDGTQDLFPVHRIYCVGRNYAAHAREMGHDPDREPPFFFMKPADTVVPDGGEFPYPDQTKDVHYEMELVAAIGKGGKNIPVDKALDHIYGYCVGLDMTRRDLQGQMKDMGRPWEIGKAFDHSAPCGKVYPASKIGHPSKGPIYLALLERLVELRLVESVPPVQLAIRLLVPAAQIGHPRQGAIWLEVNGETRQNADLQDLIWNIPEVVSYLSGLFTLAPGDLIMTGTPAGVGAIKRGDTMHGHVDGVGDITIKVA